METMKIKNTFKNNGRKVVDLTDPVKLHTKIEKKPDKCTTIS
jgi:hypothetical protein